MAVIKIFDSKGIKTLVIQGNAMDQPYDIPDEEEDLSASEDSEAEE